MVEIILTIIQMLWGINKGITTMVPQFRNLLHTVTRICILLQKNSLFIYNSFENNSEQISLGYQQTQIKHPTFAAKKKYKLVTKKGEGTFSEVVKAQNIETGTFHAIKCMKETYTSASKVNNLRKI